MLELDDQNHDELVDCTMQSETVFKGTHTDVTAATGSTVVLPYNPGSLYDQLEVGMYVFVEFHGAKKIRGAHYAGCIIEKVNVLYPENVAEHPVDSVATYTTKFKGTRRVGSYFTLEHDKMAADDIE